MSEYEEFKYLMSNDISTRHIERMILKCRVLQTYSFSISALKALYEELNTINLEIFKTDEEFTNFLFDASYRGSENYCKLLHIFCPNRKYGLASMYELDKEMFRDIIENFRKEIEKFDIRQKILKEERKEQLRKEIKRLEKELGE